MLEFNVIYCSERSFYKLNIYSVFSVVEDSKDRFFVNVENGSYFRLGILLLREFLFVKDRNIFCYV